MWQKIKRVPLYIKWRSVHTAGAWLSNCNWGNTAPYLKWAFKNVTATFYGSPSRNKMRNRSTSLSPSLSQVTRYNKSRSGLSRRSINGERSLSTRRDIAKYLLTDRSEAYRKLRSCLLHIKCEPAGNRIHAVPLYRLILNCIYRERRDILTNARKPSRTQSDCKHIQ